MRVENKPNYETGLKPINFVPIFGIQNVLLRLHRTPSIVNNNIQKDSNHGFTAYSKSRFSSRKLLAKQTITKHSENKRSCTKIE